jgi:trigger factor
MATVTKENIGLLHDKLTLKLEKADYLPSFEKVLKDYSKKANIPGFRKGQVPAGLIKKMYGSSLFTDEVLRSVDRELMSYLETDKLDIFAQPLPLEMNLRQLDVNNPADYTFQFEIGMKPSFNLPDLATTKIIRYKVEATDEMIDNEISRLQNRHGNMVDQETVNSEEDVLNVNFIETDAAGNEMAVSDQDSKGKKENSILVKYFSEGFRGKWMGKKVGDSETAQLKTAFDEKEREWIINDLGLKDNEQAAEKYFKIEITKIGLLQKRELNEEFFEQLYPGKEIKTGEAFKNKIKEEIEAYWNNQARNQIHDQVFHQLVDHTQITFPEGFLKKWLKTQNTDEKNTAVKTDEQVEQEFPTFISQLKWNLITDKIVSENAIQVAPDEIRNFAKSQLFSYMGGANLSDDQPWVNDYVERMMKDRKYVEDAYNRLQAQKIFEWAETKVNPVEKIIGAEEFTKMVEAHQHHHH